MGLSWQQGPLSEHTVGRLLVPDPLPERLLYAEPLRRRMRVRFGGAWIADSDDVVLLHEPGRYPVAYFPLSDIVPGALQPSEHTTSHRDLGPTSWYTVQAGAQSTPRAAWEHIGLPAHASDLKGRIAFAWRAMDAFYEEDERIVGHAADSYHRIDVRQTSRHLVVQSGDQIIADSARPFDSYTDAPGPIAATVRQLGIRSAVACPITVEGRLWGYMAVASKRPQPLPADTETHIAGFTELAASRARIVRSADQTRRRIERDLHDGIQQRLVSLGLDLRAAQAAVPTELPELQARLGRVAEGLGEALEELRELSRGIHPAILSQGGLGPALKALARRSAVPVELDVHLQERLPAPVEVAAYYVVAEALTNAAKHAHASVAQIDVRAQAGRLRLSIGDDGVGGADPARGSGLVGLSDRVQALGGTLTVHSPAGAGTRLLVDLPVEVDGD